MIPHVSLDIALDGVRCRRLQRCNRSGLAGWEDPLEVAQSDFGDAMTSLKSL